VLVTPLLLVALGLLELLLRTPTIGVGPDDGVFVDGSRPPHREETDNEQRHGDSRENDDRKHAVSLLAQARRMTSLLAHMPSCNSVADGASPFQGHDGYHMDKVLNQRLDR